MWFFAIMSQCVLWRKALKGHQTEWHSNARLIYICIQHTTFFVWKFYFSQIWYYGIQNFYCFPFSKPSKGQRSKKCLKVRILTKISHELRGGQRKQMHWLNCPSIFCSTSVGNPSELFLLLFHPSFIHLDKVF